jgi:hypothetical protein
MKDWLESLHRRDPKSKEICRCGGTRNELKRQHLTCENLSSRTYERINYCGGIASRQLTMQVHFF